MGRYAWIKSQTNIAIFWLVETAREHGDNASPVQVVTSGLITGNQGPPKGKTRRTKTKADANVGTPTPKDASSKDGEVYLVSTKELLRLATHLRSGLDTITMPRRIWRALQEAIEGRQ